MTNKEYQDRFEHLYMRLQNALRLKCSRTAMARIRDLAHLEHEIRPSIPYQVLYDRMIDRYIKPKKITKNS